MLDNASNMCKALSLILEISESSVVTDGVVDDPPLWDDDDAAVESGSLADMEHIPCFVHSLQLVVRDRLAALSSARGMLRKCSKLYLHLMIHAGTVLSNNCSA